MEHVHGNKLNIITCTINVCVNSTYEIVTRFKYDLLHYWIKFGKLL